MADDDVPALYQIKAILSKSVYRAIECAESSPRYMPTRETLRGEMLVFCTPVPSLFPIRKVTLQTFWIIIEVNDMRVGSVVQYVANKSGHF